MAVIFVTRKIPDSGLNKLRDAGHELVINDKDRVLSSEELKQQLSSRPYEGIICLLTDTIDASVLEMVPEVKIIANYAVGYNNISVSDAEAKGVVVTNTPGVLTDTVAEYTVSLILSVVKRIPEADRFTRSLKYEGWAPELLLGSDMAGKTLGIVGAGRIGSGVAKRLANGFGMKVAYYDVKKSDELEAEIKCEYYESLDELLKISDVVSVHVPLIPATQHLINAERLAMMKSTAYLINTSRGPVIDEVALVEALKNKTIRGAGMDVFEKEPVLASGLTDLENVVITPHIASASYETRNKMSDLVAENIIDFFNGNIPQHVVKSS